MSASEDQELLWKIVRQHVAMLSALAGEARSGVDPDELLTEHELLHAFADEISEMDEHIEPLAVTDRATVAASVLEDMYDELATAMHRHDSGQEVDFADVGERMGSLFRELAACIPDALARYRRQAEVLDAWMEGHPEVGLAMLAETSESTLDPYELLGALRDWMDQLDDEERDELRERFQTDPEGVVRESLRRAELARELEAGIVGLEPGDTPQE